MRVGSLFTGIGAADLGLERAGLKTAWQVEIDPEPVAVLERHWPGVERHRDVQEVGAKNLARVDLIAGGFPCTGVSSAGKREGLAHEDSALWHEMARIVSVVRPAHVLVENPAALLHPGRGMDAVVLALVRLGYFIEWDCIPASAVGAPHIRDRVWIVASKTAGRRIPHHVTGRWPSPPAGPFVVPSTFEVRAALRMLGRSCVPQIVEALGRSILRPSAWAPGMAVGVLRGDRWVGAQEALLGEPEPMRWPRAGEVRDGIVYRRKPIAKAPRTRGGRGAPLPTPTAEDYGASGNARGHEERRRPSLSTMARQGTLPTPTSTDASASRRFGYEGGTMHPGTTLLDELLPTPVAADGGRCSDAYGHGASNPTLTGWLRLYPTPLANIGDRGRMDVRGANAEGGPTLSEVLRRETLPTPVEHDGRLPHHTRRISTAEHSHGESLAEATGATEARGLPNPTFVEWMMGLPHGWVLGDCGDPDRWRCWLGH